MARCGTYQLHLLLSAGTTLRIGALGTFHFPAGRYVYTGSALSGLDARIARHLRKEKKLRWHIDYFLQCAQVQRVVTFLGPERRECEKNRRVLRKPGATVLAPGFGSSDCRCTAHLVFLGSGKGSAERSRRRKKN